jgi:hypothetical protein
MKRHTKAYLMMIAGSVSLSVLGVICINALGISVWYGVVPCFVGGATIGVMCGRWELKGE